MCRGCCCGGGGCGGPVSSTPGCRGVAGEDQQNAGTGQRVSGSGNFHGARARRRAYNGRWVLCVCLGQRVRACVGGCVGVLFRGVGCCRWLGYSHPGFVHLLFFLFFLFSSLLRNCFIGHIQQFRVHTRRGACRKCFGARSVSSRSRSPLPLFAVARHTDKCSMEFFSLVYLPPPVSACLTPTPGRSCTSKSFTDIAQTGKKSGTPP